MSDLLDIVPELLERAGQLGTQRVQLRILIFGDRLFGQHDGTVGTQLAKVFERVRHPVNGGVDQVEGGQLRVQDQAIRVGDRHFERRDLPDQKRVRGEVLLRCPFESMVAQPVPVLLDVAKRLARCQATRQHEGERMQCARQLGLLGGAPFAQRRVAAQQCRRQSAVQLQGLHGSRQRLDQCQALQLSSRRLDHAAQVDEQAINHHRNGEQGHQPQQRKFLAVAHAVQQRNGRGEERPPHRRALIIRPREDCHVSFDLVLNAPKTEHGLSLTSS